MPRVCFWCFGFWHLWPDVRQSRRTGYIGELGFEILCPIGKTVDVWNALVAAGGDDIPDTRVLRRLEQAVVPSPDHP